MSWEDRFRELETERKQREEEERSRKKEEERIKKEHRKIVLKFVFRIARTIGEFCKASGCKPIDEFSPLSEFNIQTYDGRHITVRIDVSCGFVSVDCGSVKEVVPLSTFTEEALATALVIAYKGRQS